MAKVTGEMEMLLDELCEAVRNAAPSLSFAEGVATVTRFVAMFIADNMVHPDDFIDAIRMQTAHRLMETHGEEAFLAALEGHRSKPLN